MAYLSNPLTDFQNLNCIQELQSYICRQLYDIRELAQWLWNFDVLSLLFPVYLLLLVFSMYLKNRKL